MEKRRVRLANSAYRRETPRIRCDEPACCYGRSRQTRLRADRHASEASEDRLSLKREIGFRFGPGEQRLQNRRHPRVSVPLVPQKLVVCLSTRTAPDDLGWRPVLGKGVLGKRSICHCCWGQ